MVNKLDNEPKRFVCFSVAIYGTTLTPLELEQRLQDLLIHQDFVESGSDLFIDIEEHSGWCKFEECGSDNEHDYMKNVEAKTIMKYSDDVLRDIFTYHAPTSADIPKYEKIRDAAFEFSKILRDNTMECADQSAAIRKLRECVMTANAAIALKGVS